MYTRPRLAFWPEGCPEARAPPELLLILHYSKDPELWGLGFRVWGLGFRAPRL